MLGLGSRAPGESQSFVPTSIPSPVQAPIGPVSKTSLASALALAQAAITAAGTLATLTLAQLVPVRSAVSTALASFAAAVAALDGAITTTSVAGASTSLQQTLTSSQVTSALGMSDIADSSSGVVSPGVQPGTAIPTMVAAILAQNTYIRQMAVILNAQGYLARINTNLQNATE